MRILLSIYLLIAIGCVSKEERCRRKVERGRFASMEQCYNPPPMSAEERERLRRIGNALQGMGAAKAEENRTLRQNKSQCGPNQIAPMASINCRNVCINGSWSEVCN
jgi:hypothetical protein